MKPYQVAEDLLGPILRVTMPRAGQLHTPGGTVHVVARGNYRETRRREQPSLRAGGTPGPS